MFVPRHPVVENQFCQFTTTSTTTGVGGALAYAGSVCYLLEDATNQDALVTIYSTTAPGSDMNIPFGFLMQKVKEGYHAVHPPGFVMPGDLGSSDVIAQPSYNSSGTIDGTKLAPVAVGHWGIWDTVHYMVKYSGGTPAAGTAVVSDGDHMKPGQLLYVCKDGYSRVTNDTSNTAGYGALDDVDSYAVARVVRGGSYAQCQANINNTTLFPIRIKLLL